MPAPVRLPTDDELELAKREMLARLQLADDVLDGYAEEHGIERERVSPDLVKIVRKVCLELDWDDFTSERSRPQPFRRARRDFGP